MTHLWPVTSHLQYAVKCHGKLCNLGLTDRGALCVHMPVCLYKCTIFCVCALTQKVPCHLEGCFGSWGEEQGVLGEGSSAGWWPETEDFDGFEDSVVALAGLSLREWGRGVKQRTLTACFLTQADKNAVSPRSSHSHFIMSYIKCLCPRRQPRASGCADMNRHTRIHINAFHSFKVWKKLFKVRKRAWITEPQL